MKRLGGARKQFATGQDRMKSVTSAQGSADNKSINNVQTSSIEATNIDIRSQMTNEVSGSYELNGTRAGLHTNEDTRQSFRAAEET